MKSSLEDHFLWAGQQNLQASLYPKELLPESIYRTFHYALGGCLVQPSNPEFRLGALEVWGGERALQTV